MKRYFICNVTDNSVICIMFHEAGAHAQAELLNSLCGEKRYHVITDSSKVVWKD